MKVVHIPTPYKVKANPAESLAGVSIWQDCPVNRKGVARLCMVHDEAEVLATADFIVRACNTHDQLVDALREAIEIIQAIDQTDNTCDRRVDVSEFRAALAAAGAA